MKLYKDRGVNPASGCLPAVLQLLLLLPMYQVFSQGLIAPNISSMLQVFGQPGHHGHLLRPDQPARAVHRPQRLVARLAAPDHATAALQFYPGGLPANLPEIFIMVLPGLFGLSLLALASALLQLVQTRMMTTPSDDPQQRTPAAGVPHPAAVLAHLRLVPAGRPVHLLDHDHHLLHRPAVPHQWLGRAVPALRLDARVRARPHAAIPSSATHPASSLIASRLPEARPAPPSARRQTARQGPSGRRRDAAAGEGDADERVPGVHRADGRGGHPRTPASPSGSAASMTSTSRSSRPAAAACWAWAPSRPASSPRHASALGGARAATGGRRREPRPPPRPPAPRTRRRDRARDRPRDDAPRDAGAPTRRPRPRARPPSRGPAPAGGLQHLGAAARHRAPTGRRATTAAAARAAATATVAPRDDRRGLRPHPARGRRGRHRARASLTTEREEIQAAEASPEALAAGKDIVEQLVGLMGYRADGVHRHAATPPRSTSAASTTRSARPSARSSAARASGCRRSSTWST